MWKAQKSNGYRKIHHTIDPAAEEKAYEFLNAIEDLDDVQNVYTNLG